MPTFEIPVFAYAELYRSVFQGVALLSGSGGMVAGAARLLSVIGLLYVLMTIAVRPANSGALMKWFLTASVIWFAMFVPRANVLIVDQSSGPYVYSNPTTLVSDVPIGIAFPASVFMRISDRATYWMDSALNVPTSLSYSRQGFMVGARVTSGLLQADVGDPDLKINLESYMKNCVVERVADGSLDVNALSTSPDVWALVKSGTSNLLTEYRTVSEGTAQTSWMSCEAVEPLLDSALGGNGGTAAFGDAQRAFASALFPQAVCTPGATSCPALTAMNGVLNGFATTMVNASQSGEQIFRNALMSNALHAGLDQYAVGMGGEQALEAYARTRSDTTMRAQNMMTGLQAEKWVSMLRVVLELLAIGTFPLLLPVFLLPHIGFKALSGFMSGLAGLALWGPLYSILNAIMTTSWLGAVMAAGAVGNNTSFVFALSTFEGLAGASLDIMGLAGWLSAMVPAMAGAIVLGGPQVMQETANSFAGMVQGNAARAADEVTTGNMSTGAITQSSVQVANATVAQSNMAPRASYGMSGASPILEAHTPGGNTVTYSPDGSNWAINTGSMMSSLGAGLGSRSGYDLAVTNASGLAERRRVEAARSFNESYNAMSAEERQAVDRQLSSNGWRVAQVASTTSGSANSTTSSWEVVQATSADTRVALHAGAGGSRTAAGDQGQTDRTGNTTSVEGYVGAGTGAGGMPSPGQAGVTARINQSQDYSADSGRRTTRERHRNTDGTVDAGASSSTGVSVAQGGTGERYQRAEQSNSLEMHRSAERIRESAQSQTASVSRAVNAAADLVEARAAEQYLSFEASQSFRDGYDVTQDRAQAFAHDLAEQRNMTPAETADWISSRAAAGPSTDRGMELTTAYMDFMGRNADTFVDASPLSPEQRDNLSRGPLPYEMARAEVIDQHHEDVSTVEGHNAKPPGFAENWAAGAPVSLPAAPAAPAGVSSAPPGMDAATGAVAAGDASVDAAAGRIREQGNPALPIAGELNQGPGRNVDGPRPFEQPVPATSENQWMPPGA